MTVGPYPEHRLEAYHFHERDWDSYEALQDGFEWEIPDRMNLAEYVCDRHSHDRGTVAIFYEDARGSRGKYTFWELKRVSNRLANYLETVGFERGDRLAICVSRRPETALGHIGTWKAGGASVPLSTLFGPDGLRYRLEDGDARVIVGDEVNIENIRAVKDEVDSLEEVLVVGDVDPEADETHFEDAIENESVRYDPVDTDAEDDCMIPYTSGTTGDPKGVRYAHRTLLGHLPGWICAYCNGEFRDDDVFWHPTGWAWVGSLYDLVMPALYYGKPVLAYEPFGSFDPERAFELIERYELTCMYIPPTAQRMMMNAVDDPAAAYDLDSVRVLGSGGEGLGETLSTWGRETFGAAIHEAYGQTEASILVANCSQYFEYRNNIGKPMPGMDVRIVDPDEGSPATELDRGELGEIAVREDTATMFTEYLGKPDQTDATFSGDWMLTGDLAVMDEDGYVTFVSRKDDVIIASGYRIGPEEVEDSLTKHEAVADAGVIGVDDPERGTVVRAYVVLLEGSEPSAELASEIQQFVKDRLAKYEYPREIEFIDELPKTSTGKVRRKSLREREDG